MQDTRCNVDPQVAKALVGFSFGRRFPPRKEHAALRHPVTTLHLDRGAIIPVASTITGPVLCIRRLSLLRHLGRGPVAELEPRSNPPGATFMQPSPATAARADGSSGVGISFRPVHMDNGGHWRRLHSAEHLRVPCACHNFPIAHRTAGPHDDPAPQVLDTFFGPCRPLPGLRHGSPIHLRSAWVTGPPATLIRGSLTPPIPEIIRILRASEHKTDVSLPDDHRVAALPSGLSQSTDGTHGPRSPVFTTVVNPVVLPVNPHARPFPNWFVLRGMLNDCALATQGLITSPRRLVHNRRGYTRLVCLLFLVQGTPVTEDIYAFFLLSLQVVANHCPPVTSLLLTHNRHGAIDFPLALPVPSTFTLALVLDRHSARVMSEAPSSAVYGVDARFALDPSPRLSIKRALTPNFPPANFLPRPLVLRTPGVQSFRHSLKGLPAAGVGFLAPAAELICSPQATAPAPHAE